MTAPADRRSDHRHLDEDDVRVRPGRGTRPRSKNRPAHDDAGTGMVVTVDRGRYTVLLGGPSDPQRDVTAMRARELGRRGIAVGDQVSMVGDLSGDSDTLARIVRIGERDTVLRRTADDTDPVERVIVANADQLAIVASLANPQPRYGLIDRCLVAALTEGLEPLLCLTKSDLAPPDDALARYSELDVPAVVTRIGGDLAPLRGALAGQVTVLVGHSGVGKSTLINALVPAAGREIGEVTAIGKGRHTSSSAFAFPLAGGGWVIDTPGVRSFGLAHVGPDDLLWAFPDLEDGATQCPPGCQHASAADGCALDAWVADRHSTPARLAAFRRLLASRAPSGGASY
jgi:ribosome biogenesis GTPase / thiamine phosphate phosphatase